MKYIVRYPTSVGPEACNPYLVECRGQAYEGQFEVCDITPAAPQWGTDMQEVEVDGEVDFGGLRTRLMKKWLGVREGEEWFQSQIFTLCDPVIAKVGDWYENASLFERVKPTPRVTVTNISDPYELYDRSYKLCGLQMVDVEITGHAGNDVAFEHGAIELLRGGPLVHHKQPVQNGPVQNGPGWSKTDQNPGGVPSKEAGVWDKDGV